MNKSFREYCEEVVARLNELDIDNEFSFTLEDLLNGDPFQELMSNEANKLRKEFYSNVQKYSAILPSKSEAKRDLSVYKAQLEFINARLAELNNQEELQRSINLDNWYLDHKDTYSEEKYKNKLKEDQDALSKAKTIYQDNLDLIASQYNSSKTKFDKLTAELQSIEAGYNLSRENYIIAHYANNMTKEALEKIVKRQDYIKSLEAVYNERKDPAIKAIIDKEKKSMADRDLADCYKKAYDNYDSLKGANLEILKAQMELDKLKFEAKKREVTKAKRSYTKAEKLIGLDMSKFDSKEALEEYRKQLELITIEVSSINTVNKENVNLLAQAILKQEELNNNNVRGYNQGQPDQNQNGNGQPNPVQNAQQDPNQNGNGQPNPVQSAQPDQNQNGNGQNLGYDGDSFPMDMNFIKGVVKKSEYCSDQVFTLAQKALANRTWIGTCIANRRIAQAAKLGILKDEEKAIIQSARANTNVNLGKNAAFWQIAESLKDRIDNQNATNKVAEEIKQANQEKFNLENSYATGTKEEQEALLIYGKIKDMSRQEVENIRNTYAGDMRAVSAQNIQKLLDVELNRLTNNGWSKYQQDNPNKVVLSSDKDAIKALGISNDADLKEASHLMQTRNYLQVIANSNKIAEIYHNNNNNREESLKDPVYAEKSEQSRTIMKNELKTSGKISNIDDRDKEFKTQLEKTLKYSTERLRDNNIISNDDKLELDKETSRTDFEHAVAIYDKVDQIKKDVVSGLRHSERYEVSEGLGDETVTPTRHVGK